MDQLEEIRQKIDIVELISQSVNLKKAGRNFKALCPFHSEKTPSFIVSPERQIFKCFGCQIGGDIFKFFMEMEKVEFGEAVRALAKRAGVVLKTFKPSKEYEKKQKLFQINHLASEYFHYLLTQHPVGQEALEYLTKRGITKKSIKEFKLGYAPDSWEGLLDWLVKKKGYQYLELEAAGLAIRGRGWYARFRGRIIFPLIDLQNNIIGFSGRVLSPQTKKTHSQSLGTNKAGGAKYINSPETILYHKSRHLYGLSVTKNFIKKKNEVILTEGELDVISSYQAKVKQVVAIKGSALTEDQVQLLKRFCETLILALDADQAGEAAVRQSAKLVEAAGLNLKVVKLPEAKDPDELAQKDPKQWQTAVKKAVSIYDFVIYSVVKRFGVNSSEAKRKVTTEVVPWLSQIENEVVKAHFVKKLAQALDVDDEAVMTEVDKKIKSQNLSRKIEGPTTAKTPTKSRRESLEEYLLSLLVQADFWQQLIEKVNLTWIATHAIEKILSQLKKASPKITMVQFAQGLPKELQAVFDLAFLRELPELSKEKWQQELERILLELEKLYLYDRLSELRQDLRVKKKKQREAVLIKINDLLKQIQLLNYGEKK